METERICPGCGRPVKADSPQGLCPECLIKSGFATGAAPEPGAPTSQPPFAAPSVEEMAKLFPQFEIAEMLGRGGMGAVYKARQPHLDRWVALKILPPQLTARPGFIERFNREARALAKLGHPNIVAVHEFGQAGGMAYFVMEYVEGVTLRRLVKDRRLDPREALKIVPQICEALQFAHEEGVVHRDIKPENILLDKKGRVKIADFGIAKLVSAGAAAGSAGEKPPANLTAEQVLGTPQYMAPEQLEKPGTVDHRADIYSLGVVFYEMLTGELPVGKFQPPSKKVAVDVRLDEVVLHTLEKEPERRYQTASQVKCDVETISNSGPGGRAESGSADLVRAVGRHRVQAPAIAMMIAAGLNYLLLVMLIVSQPTGIPNLPVLLLGALFNGLVLIGADQMRRGKSYGLAVTASILVMLLPPACFVGLPLGIWSLIVLTRREVGAWFEIPQLPPELAQANRGSGAWKVAAVIVGAILLVLSVPAIMTVLAIILPAVARQKARLAETSRPPAVELHFEPVQQAMLNDLDDSRGGEALDLDTGRLLDLPERLKDRPEVDQLGWIEEERVDLLVDRANGRWGLVTVIANELLLAPVPNTHWEGMTEHTMTRALFEVSSGLEFVDHGSWRAYLPQTNAPPPMTFAFRTADGARGLLRIERFTDDPPAMSVQYKLVRGQDKKRE